LKVYIVVWVCISVGMKVFGCVYVVNGGLDVWVKKKMVERR
jgi:hypothetical protein